MSLLTLHLLGSPVLRQRSAEVEVFDDELKTFIDDMFETMAAAKGVGLAANQVGVARRVAVVDAEGQRFAMVNPRIVRAEGKGTAEEGCLSIPELREDVTRHAWLRVRGLDAQGKTVEFECDDLLARAVQHEVDHLDGVLYIDRLSPLKRKLLSRRLKEIASENAPRARE